MAASRTILQLIAIAALLPLAECIPILTHRQAEPPTNETNLNSTQADAEPQLVPFYKPPNVRGTVDLVITCLLTYVFCVSTVLHPELPPNLYLRGCSWTKKWAFFLLRELGNIVMCLFVPESVMGNAIGELVHARSLTRSILAIIEEKEKHGVAQSTQTGNSIALNNLNVAQGTEMKKEGRKYQWTDAHSYLCLEGGFVLETDCGESYIPGSPQLCLTARGMLLLAMINPDLLPQMTREEIEDKGKANGWVKLLVCLQVSWFLVQTIARAAQNLTVTPLEINVLSHVIIAVVLYYFWWDKPQRVEEPVVLRGPWVRPIAAWMWAFTNSRDITQITKIGDLDAFAPATEPTLAQKTMHDYVSAALEPGTTISEEEAKVGDSIVEILGREVTRLKHEDCFKGCSFPSHTRVYTGQVCGPEDHPLYDSTPDEKDTVIVCKCNSVEKTGLLLRDWVGTKSALRIDTERMRRLALLAQAIEQHPILSTIWWARCNPYDPVKQFISPVLVHTKAAKVLSNARQFQITNDLPFEASQVARSLQFRLRYIVLIFAILGYGAINFFLWNYTFPTRAERLLWRICSILGVASSVVTLSLVVMAVWSQARVITGHAGKSTSLVALFFQCISAAAALILFAVRGIFLFEALFCLRLVPPDVYQTTSWSQFWPHF